MTTRRRDIRVLSADDVRKALPMTDAIEAMREAFRQLASGHLQMPVRAHIDVAKHRGTALIMPSYAACFGNIGVKIVNVFEGNAERELPRIQALVCLFDDATGTPRALLDGTALTALRTGAACGLATDLLARPDASTVAILGAGVQGRTQLEGVAAVRTLRAVRVYDPQPQAAETFAAEMRDRFADAVAVAASPAAAIKGADIVCAATVSSDPVFDDADVAPGTHINAIGSYQPRVQEIPEATVCRAQVVVDHRESALAEAGDLIVPIRQGLITESHIRAELGEILLGKAEGRGEDKAITLFKSVGVAIQDLAAASRALARAEAEGLGTTVSL